MKLNIDWIKMTKKCLNSWGCNEKLTIHLEFYDSRYINPFTGVKGKSVNTDNFCSKECYEIYLGYIKPPSQWKQQKKRGVKSGSQRGKYKTKKRKSIANKYKITETCKQCNRKFNYKRKGKRLKNYCSDSCRQKAYRIRKKAKEKFI
jgi:hypothetical protein